MAHEVEKSPAMSVSTTAISTGPIAATQDILTKIFQDGARLMLAQTVQAEVAAWIEEHANLKDQAGRQQVVRNSYLPERTLLTGIGLVAVKQPRVHGRRPSEEREKLTVAILPPYLRRTKSLEELIPCLYLKGISAGDFSEALLALLGPDAPGLAAATISRLKAVWEEEHIEWRWRSLESKQGLAFPPFQPGVGPPHGPQSPGKTVAVGPRSTRRVESNHGIAHGPVRSGSRWIPDYQTHDGDRPLPTPSGSTLPGGSLRGREIVVETPEKFPLDRAIPH
jgi:hypothetical protein